MLQEKHTKKKKKEAIISFFFEVTSCRQAVDEEIQESI